MIGSASTSRYAPRTLMLSSAPLRRIRNETMFATRPAAAGLVANIVSFLILRKGAEESINVRGAYLEVLADPIIGVAIGLFVLPRTYALARRALRILFQHAPKGVDVAGIQAELGELK